ncbi:MAG: hypothetical protein D6738_14235 [Acidobacteria bacterium]|nr:MAG: hypothetical protein D6738_14235 [Acidobacteriota bacterium]
MNCPACGKPLSERVVEGVAVDVCRHGCGGLWFDAGELQRFDEPDEPGAGELDASSAGASPPPRRDRPLPCPRCRGSRMMRRWWSVRRQVEIDECPTCGGIWLDRGELAALRALFASEDERRAEARRLAESLLAGRPRASGRRFSTGALERAQRVVGSLPFLDPDESAPPG